MKPQPCKKSADLATCERPLNLHASKKGRGDGSVKWAAIIMTLTFGIWSKLGTPPYNSHPPGNHFSIPCRGGGGGVGGRGRKRDID
jgi:hypothetical protein